MAWNHDLPPIEYLEKRLRYYTRTVTYLENLIIIDTTDNRIKWKLRKEMRVTVPQVRKAIEKYTKRVIEYQSALNKLKTNKP